MVCGRTNLLHNLFTLCPFPRSRGPGNDDTLQPVPCHHSDLRSRYSREGQNCSKDVWWLWCRGGTWDLRARRSARARGARKPEQRRTAPFLVPATSSTHVSEQTEGLLVRERGRLKEEVGVGSLLLQLDMLRMPQASDHPSYLLGSARHKPER